MKWFLCISHRGFISLSSRCQCSPASSFSIPHSIIIKSRTSRRNIHTEGKVRRKWHKRCRHLSILCTRFACLCMSSQAFFGCRTRVVHHHRAFFSSVPDSTSIIRLIFRMLFVFACDSWMRLRTRKMGPDAEGWMQRKAFSTRRDALETDSHLTSS